MLNRLPMRGTLLNAATVAVGALVGLALGKAVPQNLMGVVIVAIGLVNMLFAVKMFFKGSDILITVVSVALGGIVGTVLHFHDGLAAFAEWAKQVTGGGGHFTEALITTSVLYCVGPMTILGCLKDGLEGDIELLKLKSMLDGLTAVFIAASLGSGVLVTALVVLVFQGALTLLARPLQPIAKDPAMVDEMSAVGGVLLLSIGLGLAGVKSFQTEAFLPGLVLAPAIVWAKARFGRRPGASEALASPGEGL